MARAMDSGHARRARMRATSTLLLAAQLITLGHLLIVRHTICPEHGEAIHSESLSHAQATSPSDESAAAGAALGSGAPPTEHAHDHCLARANPRERFALLRAPHVLADPPPPTAILLSLSAVSMAPAVAALLIAPKNSPPWA